MWIHIDLITQIFKNPTTRNWCQILVPDCLETFGTFCKIRYRLQDRPEWNSDALKRAEQFNEMTAPEIPQNFSNILLVTPY